VLPPVKGEGSAFLKACKMTGQCQRKRPVVEQGNAGAVKTHPGLHLRKEGLEQALFGAERQRESKGERVSRAGKHRFFLLINNAVFDFPGFVFGKDRFTIDADKRRVMRDDGHRLRAAVGDAAGNTLRPERFAAGADAGDYALV